MATRAPYHKAFERLYAIAEAQEGYFTAMQAAEVGFDSRNHPYHVRAGFAAKNGAQGTIRGGDGCQNQCRRH